ncbi:hypothetical protein [Tateyamaria sp. syn59]|uniref:hypothetical protein n=1 Tax=Tateyamaria sp. syn59 TaxID=2576942 RepID=UPI0011BF41B4|nr:hypothetical protein [Tateyamaria sp. syn59]
MKDNKPTLVWALYSAGIAAILTPFIAVALAYIWRGKAEAPARMQYDTQIKVFWRCGLIWLIAFAVMVVGVVTDTSPAGSGMSTLFAVGLLIALAGQLWFTVRSLIGLVKCFTTPSAPMATA